MIVNKGHFYCGTSNIVLPVPNKAFFPEEYQDKSRLQYYASLFNSLEVNSSFYKIPMPGTVARWVDEVPGHFAFTFKIWRDITHAKELLYTPESIERFLLSVNNAGSKRGCLLLQFPASVRFSSFGKVTTLIGHLKERAAGWRIAVEFRDRSWYRDDVFAFLESSAMTLVQHDMPHSGITFPDLQSDFIFLRFHGQQGDYKGSYDDAFLSEYAQYIHDWTSEGKTVFAYFNNTIGDAVHNALRLQQYYSKG